MATYFLGIAADPVEAEDESGIEDERGPEPLIERAEETEGRGIECSSG